MAARHRVFPPLGLGRSLAALSLVPFAVYGNIVPAYFAGTDGNAVPTVYTGLQIETRPGERALKVDFPVHRVYTERARRGPRRVAGYCECVIPVRECWRARRAIDSDL